MSQKGFVNIILIVFVMIVIGVAGYFVFVKRPEPIISQPTPSSISPTPTPPSSIDNGKTSHENPPSGTQKKVVIRCKPTVLSSGQGDVVFLPFALSLITPCPTDTGIMRARATVGPLGSDQKAINLDFSSKGNITLGGMKTYSFNLSNRPVTRDVDLQIIGPGMGSLDARAYVVVNSRDNGGGADSIFFLLAEDSEFIVSRSSYFELERAKLTSDLQGGLITKAKYDSEFQKMLEGKHTYICSKITCY